MQSIIIVARSEGGVIGNKNRMPWNLPGDMQFFKETTIGHPVIMGRNTFESFPKPLANRDNIVLSNEADFSPEGALVVNSVAQAEALATERAIKRGVDEYYVIGGAQIYELFIDRVDAVYLTEIYERFEGDAFFNFDFENWEKVSRDRYTDDDSKIKYEIVRLGRPTVEKKSAQSAVDKRESNLDWHNPYDLAPA